MGAHTQAHTVHAPLFLAYCTRDATEGSRKSIHTTCSNKPWDIGNPYKKHSVEVVFFPSGSKWGLDLIIWLSITKTCAVYDFCGLDEETSNSWIIMC